MSEELWREEGLYLGDCRAVLAQMPPDSADAIVTDGPYGLGFMGREWDTFSPDRVRTQAQMKQRKDPTLLAAQSNVAGRSRSPAQSPSQIEYDRSLVGQRAFQLFTEAWGAEALRVLKPGGYLVSFGAPRSHHRMMAGLEDAGWEIRDTLMWLFGQGFPKSKNLGDGWGTALKPAWEPIALARKPLGGLTTTACYAQWGTGGINIAGCRIETDDELDDDPGRWPANLLLDEVAAADLDQQVGQRTSGANPTRRGVPKTRNTFSTFEGQESCTPARGQDSGGVSRYFYCPKVSLAEREFGCQDLPLRTAGEMTGGRAEGSAGLNNPRAGAGRGSGSRNAHPTVKPLALMRWLVRLVTPPGGLVVDPFAGSGTTGIAAELEGCGFVGIDLEPEWLAVAHARIGAWRERERQRA